MKESGKHLAAAKVYYDFCKMMDDEEWTYEGNEEKLSIVCGAVGEDLPIELNIRMDVDRQLVLVLSRLPYKVPEEKRVDVAVAVSVINNVLVDGSVDFNLESGHVFFRITNSYMDSNLSGEVYGYLLYCACQTIDTFNDKLLMLSKGIIDVEQFIKLYNKE